MLIGIGKAANVCMVSPSTIHKWIDRGLLPGHRIPGSRYRRVFAADLRRFLSDHGMGYAVHALEEWTKANQEGA